MLIVENEVDLLEHPSLEGNEASKSHNSGLPLPGRNTPHLSLDFPQGPNAVMRKTELLMVGFVLSFTHSQGKKRPNQEQIGGESLVNWPICLDKFINGLLGCAFFAQMNSGGSFRYYLHPSSKGCFH